MNQQKKSVSPVAVFLTVLFLAAVPAVNLFLGWFYTQTAGDALRLTESNALSVAMYVLFEAAKYAAMALVLARILRNGRVRAGIPPLVLYFVGLLAVNAGSLVMQRLTMTADAFAEGIRLMLTTALLDIGIEVVLFCILLLIADARLRSARPNVRALAGKCRFWAWLPVLLCAAEALIWAVASTVTDLVSVGTPINAGEWIYLLSPYALIAVTALLARILTGAVYRAAVR